jgi:hypothetical protein
MKNIIQHFSSLQDLGLTIENDFDGNRDFWDFARETLNTSLENLKFIDSDTLEDITGETDLPFIPSTTTLNFNTSQESGTYQLGTLLGVNCLMTNTFGLNTYIISN